jgi:hypothetical protein
MRPSASAFFTKLVWCTAGECQLLRSRCSAAIGTLFDFVCHSVHSGNLMLPVLPGGAKTDSSASVAAWTDYGFITFKVAAAVNGKDPNNSHKRWIAPEQYQALKRMRALATGKPLNAFKPSSFFNGRDSHLRCCC